MVLLQWVIECPWFAYFELVIERRRYAGEVLDKPPVYVTLAEE